MVNTTANKTNNLQKSVRVVETRILGSPDKIGRTQINYVSASVRMFSGECEEHHFTRLFKMRPVAYRVFEDCDAIDTMFSEIEDVDDALRDIAVEIMADQCTPFRG